MYINGQVQWKESDALVEVNRYPSLTYLAGFLNLELALEEHGDRDLTPIHIGGDLYVALHNDKFLNKHVKKAYLVHGRTKHIVLEGGLSTSPASSIFTLFFKMWEMKRDAGTLVAKDNLCLILKVLEPERYRSMLLLDPGSHVAAISRWEEMAGGKKSRKVDMEKALIEEGLATDWGRDL